MNHRLEVTLGGVTAIAELHLTDAPRTCRAVLHALPLAGRAVPGLVSGSAVLLAVDRLSNIPFENQTIYPIPGDLAFYLEPVAYLPGQHAGHKRHQEVIAVVYGRDTQMMGPVLPLPLNIFGSIVEGLDGLAAEVGRMKREGFGEITLALVERSA